MQRRTFLLPRIVARSLKIARRSRILVKNVARQLKARTAARRPFVRQDRFFFKPHSLRFRKHFARGSCTVRAARRRSQLPPPPRC